MTIKEALKYLRDVKKEKVTIIVKKLGISRNYYYNIINNERSPHELFLIGLKQNLKDKYDIIVDESE